MRQFKISERLTPRSSRAAMMYLTEVERTKVLDPDTESKVAYRAAAGDQQARELLVTSNLRFVLSVAKMYSSKPEDFPDLVAAGNEGLYEASGKFDPSRGFKFISFAVWYIRKEMIKYLSEHSRTIKIPTNQAQNLKAVLDAGGDLAALEGREVSNEEALEFLKEKNPKYASADFKILNSALLADRKPASLQSELNNDKDAGTLLDVIAAEGDRSDEILLEENAKTSIQLLMRCLTPFERDLVRRAFGIGNSSGLEDSFQKIANDTGYSPESIRAKTKRAILKMQKYSKKAGIEL